LPFSIKAQSFFRELRFFCYCVIFIRAYPCGKKQQSFLPCFLPQGRAFGFIFIFLKKKNKGYRRNPLRKTAASEPLFLFFWWDTKIKQPVFRFSFLDFPCSENFLSKPELDYSIIWFLLDILQGFFQNLVGINIYYMIPARF
jgi:hypothetical protein